ncbi:MAG: tRNA (guanosine(46)-N7)-methyltransferase TrmB [Candidatus Methylomirabilis sp.]|nr:tRNA (guanosine(46)-N7)-methyltransferase TrmB [Deltaproteobacteria bacterium]
MPEEAAHAPLSEGAEASPEASPLLPLSAFETPLDWTRVFGRAGPVEVDIGSGKGRFLIESGRAHPERNFLGIERSLKWIRHAEERVVKSRLRNVRLVCADAAGLVAQVIPDASVSAYHLYHPDPWPKKRHHKRRIVKPEFVADLARTLAPGGALRVQSDVRELFEEMDAAFGASPAFERMPFEMPNREDFDGFTSFERKYLAEGRDIHRAQFRRRG